MISGVIGELYANLIIEFSSPEIATDRDESTESDGAEAATGQRSIARRPYGPRGVYNLPCQSTRVDGVHEEDVDNRIRSRDRISLLRSRP